MPADATGAPLDPAAYLARPSPAAARDLIGCTLLVDGVGGRIVEVEAYGPGDPASHTWPGRTARNWPMWGPPGHVYVYRSYGIHWCLNLVCEREGIGAAVLVRALVPEHGRERDRGAPPRASGARLVPRPGLARAQPSGSTCGSTAPSLAEPPFRSWRATASCRCWRRRASASRARPSGRGGSSRPGSPWASGPSALNRAGVGPEAAQLPQALAALATLRGSVVSQTTVSGGTMSPGRGSDV